MKKVQSTDRRRFVKIAFASVAAAPFANALLAGNAAAQTVLSETNPQAKALNYVTDATKSTMRKDAKAHCDNCNFFTARSGGKDGNCAILGGIVDAKGWCTAWVAKQ